MLFSGAQPLQRERARGTVAARRWAFVSLALAAMLLLQSALFYDELRRRAVCDSALEAEAPYEDEPVRAAVGGDGAPAFDAHAARTAIYLVPTLARESDPEMWQAYDLHIASATGYARRHGYTLVVDTTHYVTLPENRRYEDQATGSSDW